MFVTKVDGTVSQRLPRRWRPVAGREKTLTFGVGPVLRPVEPSNQRPAMQLEVKTILNRIQHFVGFVYQDIRLRSPSGKLSIEVTLAAHQGS